MPLFRAQVVIIYIIFVFLTYIPDYGWWPSLAGSALMLFICRRWLGNGWKECLGLSGSWFEWFSAVGLFLVLVTAFSLYGNFILEKEQLRFDSNYHLGFSGYYLHTCAQVFNEEVALGSIPLLCTQRALSIRSRLLLGLLLSALFPLLHLVTFHWSPFVTDYQNSLSGLSLVTLLLAGFVRNSLLLRRNHLGFTLAFHLAWNILFTGGVVSGQHGTLDEIELFNLTIGTPIAVGVLSIAALAELWIQAIRWSALNNPVH